MFAKSLTIGMHSQRDVGYIQETLLFFCNTDLSPFNKSLQNSLLVKFQLWVLLIIVHHRVEKNEIERDYDHPYPIAMLTV